MRYLCNLNVYITVEAATLIGLTFVAASSYIFRSVMARKRKSGGPKPPSSTGSTTLPAPKAVTAPRGADAKALAEAKPAAVAAPVIQEVDTRPETSPYGSPACTIPFASPLTVPLDILNKSPRLHAAYESRLPELPAITEDVGHVLVHYLHTGTYESLRPKPTDTMSKQICELKTSIQAYAAARAYDLPDLMRLAEAKIDKHGEGLPLPSLLEVARDAYPALTEADDWFLDYLRSRIRPHLKEPKSLLGSNLLDQISSILSPNRVLLRTVLELFCERIAVRSEPATSPGASAIASPITSPGTSRPISPLPPASPMSLLEMRSRSILGDEFPPARRNLRATPWPSPDNMSEASWGGSSSPEPVVPETAPPQFEAKPVPEPVPALGPFLELGPVIVDVVPPPGPSVEAKTVLEQEVYPAPEPEVSIDTEPKVVTEAESEAKLAGRLDDKASVEAGTTVAVEPEIKQEGEPAAGTVPVPLRERKDSGKGIDLEPPAKELESIPELVPEPEMESNPPPQIRARVFREADSGFWEGPDFESAKEPAPSVVELEPVLEPTVEPAHELESSAGAKIVTGVDTRDFAAMSDADDTISSNTKKGAEVELEAQEKTAPASLLVQESAPETAAEGLPRDTAECKLEPEPMPIKSAEEVPDKLTKAKDEAEATPAEEEQNKEVEAQLETEKVQKEIVEPEEVAKPEPEPKTHSPDPVHLPDGAQPAGSAEPKTLEPSVEPRPEPAGKPEVLEDAKPDSAVDSEPASRPADVAKSPAVLGTEPAPEQAGAKTEADAADAQAQPCGAQVRQRGWKKRFLSLRYPVLFGRGM